MTSKRKIIIMSKLAVYDKHYSKKDLRKKNFFRHDYVYKKNLTLRFFVLIGAVFLAILYVIHKFAIDKIEIFEIDIPAEVKNIIIIVLVLILIYTLIGTIIYNIEYEASMKRLKKYGALLNMLEKDPKTEKSSGRNLKQIR